MVQNPNLCSKACSALLAEPPIEMSSVTFSKLLDLHPDGAFSFDMTALPNMERISDFSVAEVISTLRSFKKSSSAGVSGIRPGHILSLLEVQGSNRLVHTLRSLTSKLANFEVPQCLSPLLCGARLLALRKPNGDPRPIACGDVFRRLAFIASSYGLEVLE